MRLAARHRLFQRFPVYGRNTVSPLEDDKNDMITDGGTVQTGFGGYLIAPAF
jgi:hypothetical protein